MNFSYIPIILLLVILYIIWRNNRLVTAKKIIEKRKKGDNREMIELAKRLIDKECLVYAFDSNHMFEGTIKEVTDGAILLEKNGNLEAINLDFVIRIKEYPRKKNGKKKSIVV